MRQYFVIIPLLLATTGCASVGMTLLGSAASTTVSNLIGSTAERTFTRPAQSVREGSLAALARMGVALREPGANENPEALYGRAGDRPVELEFESLGENLTVMRVTARRLGVLRDTATANEIIAQTERALELGGAPVTVTAVRPAPAAQDALPPVYILSLEEFPADGQRAMKPVPARLREYVVFTTDAERGGRRMVSVNLGYFSSEAEANEAKKHALARFPQARVSILRGETPGAPAAPSGLVKASQHL
jgi:hypothetical protein